MTWLRWPQRRGVLASLTCALLALPGCVGPGLDARQRSARTEWRSAAAPAAVPEEDPFAGAPELSREALVRAVLERNPSIRAARYAWKAALERYPQVSSLDDPMLGLGAAPRSFGSERVNDAPKFDLSQKFPFPGKLALRGEAALAEADSAARDHAAVRLRLATMASLLFDDYVLAVRSREINQEHIGLLEEFQRIATARYEVGEASQQDPIQAEVELTHALHREIVLETTQRVVAEQIQSLLHRPPRSPLPLPAPRAELPPGPTGAPEELMREALALRPELAAASARIAAEEARVDLARREFFPDLTLAGSYNRLWQERDLQPFVGIQLNVPLQLGRRRAALEEARARVGRARSERSALEDEVRFGVQSGLDRLQEARHVVGLFRDRLLPAARDQVEAARAGFETGRNSFLALIDAERNLRNVELGHQEALANLGRRRAELDRALGRIPVLGW